MERHVLQVILSIKYAESVADIITLVWSFTSTFKETTQGRHTVVGPYMSSCSKVLPLNKGMKIQQLQQGRYLSKTGTSPKSIEQTKSEHNRKVHNKLLNAVQHFLVILLLTITTTDK